MAEIYGNVGAKVNGNVSAKLDNQTISILNGIERALGKIATHLEGIETELQQLNKPKVKGSRRPMNEEETPEKKTKLKTGKEIEEIFNKLVNTEIIKKEANDFAKLRESLALSNQYFKPIRQSQPEYILNLDKAPKPPIDF